jgi:hypothetical protein
VIKGRREVERTWEGKGRSWRRRCFMEEEKRKEIQGGKRRRIDQRKGDLGDQSKGKGNLDQRGHWKEKGVFGKREGFRGSRSSRHLGLVFCLMMMMMMWFFI